MTKNQGFDSIFNKTYKKIFLDFPSETQSKERVGFMARRGENIYKRKDGRYEGRYIKYYDISGKAVYGYVYSRSYTEVKELLTKYKAERPARQSKNTVLSEWLKNWLNSQGTLKPTTKQIYKSHIDNNINPGLGKIPLKKLNRDILQGFVNSLNLSASTVKSIFSILKSALSSAEDNGLILNIWDKVKLPKKEKNIVQILTVTQQKRLESVLSSPVDVGIWICLYTGLRIGEVCALKWTDINFETLTLTVNSTQARTENGIEIIAPKSKSSKREIPIPVIITNKLKEIPQGCEYVLSKNNKPVDIRTYRRHFKKLLQKASLPDIKYHALRHTFSTRALEVGMDYKTLSEILGHSSVGITLDLYAHSLKEHKRNEMNKLGRIFEK